MSRFVWVDLNMSGYVWVCLRLLIKDKEKERESREQDLISKDADLGITKAILFMTMIPRGGRGITRIHGSRRP
jgi:hypothetical protein